MQVNTDSVAILTKQILKSEVEGLKSRLKPPASREQVAAAILVLEERIRELEGVSV